MTPCFTADKKSEKDSAIPQKSTVYPKTTDENESVTKRARTAISTAKYQAETSRNLNEAMQAAMSVLGMVECIKTSSGITENEIRDVNQHNNTVGDKNKEVEEENKETKTDEKEILVVEKVHAPGVGKIIRQMIQDEFVPKLQVKRDYKLTKNSKIDLWIDLFKSELLANELLDVVDPDSPRAVMYSDAAMKKRKGLVRDIIVNHIDEEYHRRVVNIQEPIEVLQKLREFKRNEMSVTAASVRTKLYSMKLQSDENIYAFSEKFDTVIKDYENCVGSQTDPISENDERSAFYAAVSTRYIEIRDADINRRLMKMPQLTIDEIKTWVAQIQAEKKAERPERRDVTAQRALMGSDMCYRCNKTGHRKRECWLAETRQWYCYVCKRVTDHNSHTCPTLSRGRGRGARGKRNYCNFGKRRYKNNSNGENNYKGNKSKKMRLDNEVAKEEKLNNENTRGREPGRSRGHSKKSIRGSRGQGNPTARWAGYNENKSRINDDSNNDEGRLNRIKFIADSGCSDHLIQKSIILSNFKCSNKGVIRSANKDRSADIPIDGEGNLLLYTNTPKREKFILGNVIAASGLSENLLSLAKFAEAGFGVYLDDEILDIFDKKTGESFIMGPYETPSWIVNFDV